jgi:hypothetical protein
MASSASIADALTSLRTMLAADGYELEIGETTPDFIVAEIKAGPDACADCLVPKDIMRAQFINTLRTSLGIEPPDIRLIYPTDSRHDT